MKSFIVLLLLASVSVFCQNTPTDVFRILKSGNGLSIKSAYEVDRVEEEYDLLGYLKLKPILQKLVIIDGFFYDAITTNSRVVYFKLRAKKILPTNLPQIL